MNICVNACGRLVCNLDRSLENALGYDVVGGVGGRVSAEVEPVVLVSSLAQLLDLLLQTGQPRLHQVDVLEDDPVTLLGGLGHGLLGQHLLPLSQRDVVEILV